MRPVRWTRKRGSLPAYAVLVGLTLAGGALQGQTGMVVRGNPAEGRRLFEERGCVRCHSIWGNGGVLGPDFAVVGAGRNPAGVGRTLLRNLLGGGCAGEGASVRPLS